MLPPSAEKASIVLMDWAISQEQRSILCMNKRKRNQALLLAFESGEMTSTCTPIFRA